MNKGAQTVEMRAQEIECCYCGRAFRPQIRVPIENGLNEQEAQDIAALTVKLLADDLSLECGTCR